MMGSLLCSSESGFTARYVFISIQEALDKAMGRDMEEKRHFVPPRDFTLRLQELQDKRTTRETTNAQDTD